MKRLGTLATAAALILSAGTAWAWNNVSGSIQSIDQKDRQLVLNDGKTYTVASNVNLTGLKAGDTVKLNVQQTKNGANFVKGIEQTGSQASPSSRPMTSQHY